MKPIKSLTQVFLIFILLNLSCNVSNDNLPKVYVDITLDLNKPEYYELNTPGNYVYITGGIAGIIVYHDLNGDFIAYERACPYDYNSCAARVSVTDLASGVIKDSMCCGSKYSLTNLGVVLEGPSQIPLRRYHTTYYPNSNTLSITSY